MEPSRFLKKVKRKGEKAWYKRTRVKSLVSVIGLICFFFVVNWFMLVSLQDRGEKRDAFVNSSSVSVKVCPIVLH